jgi:hypothetical protein
MFVMLRKSVVGLVFLALAPFTATLAVVEGEDTAGVRVFEPNYYVEFDPLTALEMVYRTPGFNPQERDGGRGLSGVRSNILIDGERPPPKGKSVRQRLREIPVAGVARIELIDAGARMDIDMQGYPQVVNVVTNSNPPAYYEVVTELRHSGTGDLLQQNESSSQIQATGSFSWRGHEFNMRGNLEDRDNRSPADFVAIDPANPQQRITSLNSSGRNQHRLDLGAIFELPSDSSLNFTSQFSGREFFSAPISLVDSPSTSGFVDQQSNSENDNQDLSAEYERPFGAKGSLMLALVDSRSTDRSDSSLTDDGLVRSSLTSRESGETAARLLVTRSLNERITLRTTATSAYNYFEGGFQILENGVELPIEGSDSRVEEDRHSLEASVDWNLNDKWTFRGSLGTEAYEIVSRELSTGLQTDPKGDVSISFRPQPRTTLSLESKREIGQLSFGQFLASSNLSSEILTAGAGVLEPERTWTHTASYDRRFGDVGVMRFELSHEEVENPVRSVALSDSLIVAQNTSPQKIDSARASVEFPFTRFGREDLILGLNGRIAQSNTVDPITGETRDVSGLTMRYWSAELRRDPGDGRLSWGVSVGHATGGANYSVRQISEWSQTREWGAFVEWEPIDGLKVRTNLDGPRTTMQRSSFFGAVREPGLDPSFIASTVTRMDRSASISLEWRRQDHIEITASLSTRPRILTAESLAPFGEAVASLLETEMARTPRATLRFRVYR